MKKEIKILISIVVTIVLMTFLASSYAFFNYTKTGDISSADTGYIKFDFDDGNSEISKGNVFPIEEEDIDNTVTKTFSLTGHSEYEPGMKYRVYLVYGDAIEGKTRLRDDVVTLEYTPATDGSGFTTEINNYSSPKSLEFTNGKALISTGIVKDTTELTTKTGYTIKLWIDSSKIDISSTTKRATNAEGNPSLADATSGTTTATRYMRNDTSEASTVTLYPAKASQEGKIIYTTNEFSNSYYSFRILVEAEDNEGEELVYLNTNGGSISGSNILYVTPGENYPNLPQPTRTGYTFLGWNGKNLFNIEDIYSDYYIDNNGAMIRYVSSSPWSVSTYIVVKANTTYTFNPNSTTGSSAKHALYDENKEFITYYNSGIRTFTTTSATKYVRLSFRSTSENVQLEEGSTATEYEPYYVDNTVTVTQEKDHVLTAIWQKNS